MDVLREILGAVVIIVGLLITLKIVSVIPHKLIFGIPSGIFVIILGASIAGWITLPNIFS